jgi:hypothetical protein
MQSHFCESPLTFIALEQCQTDYIYQIITMVTYIIQSDLKLYQVDPIYQMNIISDHIRWLPLSVPWLHFEFYKISFYV